jgi:transposase
MSDVDDFEDWKYDDLYNEPSEPDEPDCWHPRSQACPWCGPRTARQHRREARRHRQQRQQWRKIQRHANDRFWRARNPAYFDEAPF